MKCVIVDNIIPYLLAYVTSDIAELEPFNSWNAQELLDWDVYCSLDLDGVETDSSIRLCNRFPHNNCYNSDEVHRYEMVLFKGTPILLTYKFGDKVDTHKRVLDTDAYMEFHKHLVEKYLKKPECVLVENEPSEAVSRSYLQAFIEYDGNLYTVVFDPTWGGWVNDLSKTEVRILEADENDEVTDHGRLVSCEEYNDPTPGKKPWRKDSLRGTTDTGFNFCVDDWDRKDNNLMYAIKLGAML